MADREAEDYDNGIKQALDYFLENRLIEGAELTKHNSKDDKRGFDAFVYFKTDINGGTFSFQLKRKWRAVRKHKKKHPGVPPVIVPAFIPLKEKIELLADAFAFWKAYNYDKKSFFRHKGRNYANHYYRYYSP